VRVEDEHARVAVAVAERGQPHQLDDELRPRQRAGTGREGVRLGGERGARGGPRRQARVELEHPRRERAHVPLGGSGRRGPLLPGAPGEGEHREEDGRPSHLRRSARTASAQRTAVSDCASPRSRR
jgi:hypothetical protein